jgi:hypothetical protein
MEQLVAQVSEKIGVPADKAKQAVETVLNFLKQKLPGPLAGQIDKVVGGGGEGAAESVAKGLGDALGQK